MKDEIHPAHGAFHAGGVAHVANIKAQLARKLRVQLLVFVAHVVLLFLIARKNANLADVAVQKVLEHRVAKTACAARDKQRFSLEKFCVHGLAKLLTS